MYLYIPKEYNDYEIRTKNVIYQNNLHFLYKIHKTIINKRKITKHNLSLFISLLIIFLIDYYYYIALTFIIEVIVNDCSHIIIIILMMIIIIITAKEKTSHTCRV